MTNKNTKRVEKLKSLRYGIELELSRIDCTRAADVIKGVVGGVVERNTTYLGGWVIVMADGRKWSAVRDASLHDVSGQTCEVVSPILTWGDMDKVQEIVRALRAAGARANESCGMHVHVDGAEFKTTPAKVRNLMALAYRWEGVAVNVARVLRNRQGYCATLDGHELTFAGLSPRWGGGIATVVPSKRETVTGLLWRMSRADLDRLDEYEGYPFFYDRGAVSVTTPSGKTVWCQTYIKNTTEFRAPPSEDYLRTIIDGYQDAHARVPKKLKKLYAEACYAD